ncbi:DUF6009 family protein [Kitasatospora sp. NA04385]|uniref:DUF6009 family protein n=1 Tax=Kitasatospora sp. NA04385 TaxID=2742135 RepID=UPI0020CAC624|nr:DUF6009 family protein [Kitasatospora sp. NA04385]
MLQAAAQCVDPDHRRIDPFGLKAAQAGAYLRTVVRLKDHFPSSRVSGTFRRRVFWLLPHDRDTEPESLYATGAPSEAIDPRTIAPTIKGDKTERSQGGPASPAMVELGILLPRT